MSDFAHLHCHTEYSLLDGAIRLDDLCSKTKDLGMKACAITDHGNLFGAARFYTACKKADLKPILGCEVYVCRNHADKSGETGKIRHHLILLAENNEGYHNLVKLVSHGFIDGFYYKPRVDKRQLARYSRGLICLSACLSGEIPKAILQNDMDLARELASEYAKIFPEKFYLELQQNGIPEQNRVNASLMEIAAGLNLPLVCTNDCHYLNQEDARAHEVLLCIQTQTTMDDPDRMKMDSSEFYYKSPQEMEKAFGHVDGAIANVCEIAEKCNVELDFGNHYFPVYPVANGSSIENELEKLAEEGLEKRLASHPARDKIEPETYWKRLRHELGVISEMGFAGYFLIVQEFINWAKDNGIPVGPGRGSAAGSLVAWALRITNIDPLPYNLLFERFLNSERVSLPDIDVDFCERRRGEVIQHMVDRYGEESVAQITTFGTMKAKGAVRDVGRALGMSFAETDRIAKLVPDSLNMTIDKALEMESALRELYSDDKEVKKLIDLARRLEGLARHVSTHAAGLVVSDKPMEEYLPLYLDKKGKLVTQFDGPMTEKTGLVKFDFLGLKTMTLIRDTLDNIASQGIVPPDLDNLALTDEATYELYSRGDTDGVFQVESSGMRQYLKQLKPGCFEDIIAMLALYRPGPLGSGMVEEFIKRKHGQVPVVYPHESLENCLADTYGVIVYQEQVMQIAQIVAGYSLGGADLLRRAMGKKKLEEMAKERGKFVAGAGENNIDAKKANEIFDLMEKFAEYGFNKSHSAAYALISYFTAYLKVHYKVEFMAALLTSEMGNQDKLLKYISCCRDMGIEVVRPSINESRREFVAIGGKIVFGLGGIKNVGDEAIREIIDSRVKKGSYNSLYDLCCRIGSRKLTRRVLESLIKSGACDCFNISRAALLASMEIVASRAQKKSRNGTAPQISLLSMAPGMKEESKQGLGIDLPESRLPELSDDLLRAAEKEALGFYLTSHPLQPFTAQISRLNLQTLESTRELPAGRQIQCAILVTSVKEIVTKAKGRLMAFASVEDLTGHAEVTFFPNDYEKVRELLKSDQPLLLSAKIDSQQGEESRENEMADDEAAAGDLKLLGSSVCPLVQACIDSDEPYMVRIPRSRLDEGHIIELKNILERHKGHADVFAQVEIENIECILSLGYRVNPCMEFQKEISAWERELPV